MADWSAQRDRSRFPIALPILYRLKGPGAAKAGMGRTHSLSQKGACLELTEPVAPSTPLDVVLQTDRGTLTLPAEVIWVGAPGRPGDGILHGVTFTHLSPEEQRTLQDLVQRTGQARQAAVRVPLKLPVLCRLKEGAGLPLRGQTEDISREGLALRLPQRLPASTLVEVVLSTPQGSLTLDATVVWAATPEASTSGESIRHGLRFTNLGWTSALSLGLLLGAAPRGSPPSA